MYLDPGFGGMLLQVILGIVAVGGGILYSLRRKIRSLFSKGERNTNSEKEKTNIQENGVIDPLSDEETK